MDRVARNRVAEGEQVVRISRMLRPRLRWMMAAIVGVLACGCVHAGERWRLFVYAEDRSATAPTIEDAVWCLEFEDARHVESRRVADAPEFGHFPQVSVLGFRYFVESNGGILDATLERKVPLPEEHLVFLGAEGVIGYFATDQDWVDNPRKPRVYAVDFSIEPKFKRLRPGRTNWRWFAQAAPEWGERRFFSPDGSRYVATRSGSFTITFQERGTPRRILAENMAAGYELYVSQMPEPPVLWLNNHEVLTQRNNGQLVVLNIDGSMRPLVTVPVERPIDGVRLARDLEGTIIYTMRDAFAIDVEHGTYTPYSWTPLGHGFTVEDQPYGSNDAPRLRTGERVIRDDQGVVWGSATAPGRVAIEWREPGSKTFATEVAVWFESTGEWQRFPFRHVECVLGWYRVTN